MKNRICLFLWALPLLLSCNTWENVPDSYQPGNAFESYLKGLKDTGIDQSLMAKEWFRAWKDAMDQPVNIPLPYLEIFYFREDKPSALAYMFKGTRGQSIQIKVRGEESDSSFLFVDLFRIPEDSLEVPIQVATADSSFHELIFEPKKEAEYILRIVPEILKGGKYEISIKSTPILAFPVAGKDRWAIQSRFGAPREGGRRTHHGVDIFATRHTPIIAPVNGYVTRVDTARLGGRVIWLRDWKRGNNLYFAHLQDQWVNEGDYVLQGDTIGTVGNTGNARTTPPHLHFGIYSRGPKDPYPFIVPGDTVPDIIRQSDLVGSWARVSQKVSLRTKYGTGFQVISDFEPGTLLYINGSSGRFYRVSMEDGTQGYVLASVIENISEPLSKLQTEKGLTVYSKPGKQSSGKTIAPGKFLRVLGHHNGYLMIHTEEGETWWTPNSE